MRNLLDSSMKDMFDSKDESSGNNSEEDLFKAIKKDSFHDDPFQQSSDCSSVSSITETLKEKCPFLVFPPIRSLNPHLYFSVRYLISVGKQNVRPAKWAKATRRPNHGKRKTQRKDIECKRVSYFHKRWNPFHFEFTYSQTPKLLGKGYCLISATAHLCALSLLSSCSCPRDSTVRRNGFGNRTNPWALLGMK